MPPLGRGVRVGPLDVPRESDLPRGLGPLRANPAQAPVGVARAAAAVRHRPRDQPEMGRRFRGRPDRRGPRPLDRGRARVGPQGAGPRERRRSRSSSRRANAPPRPRRRRFPTPARRPPGPPRKTAAMPPSLRSPRPAFSRARPRRRKRQRPPRRSSRSVPGRRARHARWRRTRPNRPPRGRKKPLPPPRWRARAEAPGGEGGATSSLASAEPGRPARLIIQPLDGEGSVPQVLNANAGEMLSELRGQRYTLLVEASGRVREARLDQPAPPAAASRSRAAAETA